MPNKTIYVSEDDLPLYARAQELAGGNLSAAISRALRRFVDVEDARVEGFEEIRVRVGVGSALKKVRFTAILVAELATQTSGRYIVHRVYRSRTGKYVIHIERTPDYRTQTPDGKPAGWRGFMGLGDLTYGFTAGESTLEVVPSLEALRDKVPPELYDMVASLAKQPAIEDLDI